MKRRELTTFLTAAAIWPPLVARAQQRVKTYRLAVLTRAGQETDLTENTGFRFWRAWRDELHRLGYEEGTNLVMFRRAAKADSQDVGELIRETVKFGPDVIFAAAQNIAEAFKASASNIPVVTTALDPVGIGLAASLARPGGKVTGLRLDAGLQTLAKRVAVLKEAVPTVSRMAAARDYLAGQPYVKGDRIGVVGFSMGGGSALALMERGLVEQLYPDKFKAAVAFYPARCFAYSGEMIGPTLILIGEKDDWTLARDCRDMVEGKNGLGVTRRPADRSMIEFISYPDAWHSFDFPELRFIPGYSAFGHWIAYDDAATRAARKKVHEFLRRHLPP